MQYSNWTDIIKGDLDLKQRQRVANKLKTYINSTKFIRNGSKIDMPDQYGVLKKQPVQNVMYYQDTDEQGIPAQQLQNKIRQAILTKNIKQLKDVSKYNYYQADPAKTKQQILKQQKQNAATRLTLLSLLLGTTGTVGGTVLPYIASKLKGQKYKPQYSILGGAAGGTGGVLLSGIINRMI